MRICQPVWRGSVFHVVAVLVLTAYVWISCQPKSALAQQPRFVKTADEREGLSFNQKTLEERGGSRLVAQDQQLLRINNGSSQVVSACSLPSTGLIHDLCADPAGATYVAADEGIFLASPDTDCMMQVPLRNGAPPGRPLSIHLDKKRRLWIATDESFGVVHAGLYSGRTFDSSDGLPGEGPYAVSAENDGALLLRCSDDIYEYWPDEEIKTSAFEIVVNEKPCKPGQVLTIPFGRQLNLSFTDESATNKVFRVARHERYRYRVRSEDSHTAILGDFAPGNFEVACLAMDQDLNVSAQRNILVQVQWPKMYQPSVVLSIGTVVLILVVAGFTIVAYRQGLTRQVFARSMISAFLVIVLGLQLVAGLANHARGWPFVGWGMYTVTAQEGYISSDLVVEGIRPNGTTFPIDVKNTFSCYSSQVIHRLINWPNQAGARFVEHYNDLHRGKVLRGVQVVLYNYQLRSSGPRRIPSIIRSRYFPAETDALP